MSPPGEIDCREHGTARATYVCRHLPAGRGAGFHQALDPGDPETRFPDAWCDACERVRDEEGGWNERAQARAGLQLLCSSCYLRARLLNWPTQSVAETELLIERALSYLEPRQALLCEKYRLDDHKRYDWDQDTGQLIFSNAGSPAVVADIQFVGSVSARTRTWLWSWANGSFLEQVRAQVRRVRAYGDEHSLLKLACAYWSAEEEDGWEMSAVAAFLLEAQGVYRSPGDDHFTFMVMTDVRWAQ